MQDAGYRMKKELYMYKLYVKPTVLLLALVTLVAVGCSTQTPGVVADDGAAAAGYSGTLRADYADALDVTSQLALGTLRLEETTDAVTEAQAVAQLLLWQALSGTVLESEDEQLSVTKQVEAGKALTVGAPQGLGGSAAGQIPYPQSVFLRHPEQ